MIEPFRAALAAFPRTHTRTVTTPPVDDLRALLWGLAGAPPIAQTFHGHPDDTLELTENGDGLLTTAVPIGNYGPPEIRRHYALRVRDLACVWVCDGVDFDLPTTEITFEIAATTDALAQRLSQLVGRSAATSSASRDPSAGRTS